MTDFLSKMDRATSGFTEALQAEYEATLRREELEARRQWQEWLRELFPPEFLDLFDFAFQGNKTAFEHFLHGGTVLLDRYHQHVTLSPRVAEGEEKVLTLTIRIRAIGHNDRYSGTYYHDKDTFYAVASYLGHAYSKYNSSYQDEVGWVAAHVSGGYQIDRSLVPQAFKGNLDSAKYLMQTALECRAAGEQWATKKQAKLDEAERFRQEVERQKEEAAAAAKARRSEGARKANATRRARRQAAEGKAS